MKSFDTCTAFHTNNGAFLGRLVRLDQVNNTILDKHQYSRDVSGVLAESIALSSLLSSYLKYNGLFTLQTQSDGAISLVVVDISSESIIRAYARYDDSKIEKIRNPNEKHRVADNELLEAPHYLGKGHLAFTIDQGDQTDLYQGIVELRGNTLSEVAEKYFSQSEQVQTYIKLFLQAPQNKKDRWKSAGIMLQKLPSEGGKVHNGSEIEAEWEEAVILAQSLKNEEIFDDNLTSDELLKRLFHANDLQITHNKKYQFGCRCSKEKLRDTLISFPQEEINSMSDDNKVAVTCNFCSEQYSFDKGELTKQ